MLFPVLPLVSFLLLASPIEARKFKRDSPPSSKLGARNIRQLRSGATASSSYPTAQRAPVEIGVTDKVLTLNKVQASSKKTHSAFSLTKHATLANGSSSVLTSLEIGEEFATPITFGTQTFEVIVDTGSSDTWLVESGFTCEDISTGATITEADCDFGPTFTVDSSFSKISGVNFNITYGDGEFLSGIFGTENVTLAGIEVKQQVALVNLAAWEGDSTTSGLVGLAYPAITSEYEGTNPHDDNTQVEYSPIITTLSNAGKIDSLFSLVIERDVSGNSGYLALGGVPPIAFTQNFTSTPIIVTTIEDYPDAYDFYTINIDSIELRGKAISKSGSYEYIVDSGTTLNYFPTSIANKINKAFSPAAVYSDDDGAYIVDCDATAPAVAININGTAFSINPLDLILDAGTDETGATVCISGIDDGGDSSEDVFILGDVFQKNVVTVFDVGASELKFAGREYYASNDTY